MRQTLLGALTGAAWLASPTDSRAGAPLPRKMTLDLVCGNIGISAGQREAVDFAATYGFESVGADGSFLASLTEGQLVEFKSFMAGKNIVLGAAGLPLEFRRDETAFKNGLSRLPGFAAGLQRAGVTRVATWLSPCHEQMAYLANFHQHADRLRQAAIVLKDHGVRLGLEYVGPKTSWARCRYTFIHTLAELKDLVAEINTGNVGYVLDSWHWYHAGDTVDDLLTLKGSDVVAVDLNDAPAGIPKDQQVDNRRELPCASGVIDVGAFLTALNRVGYDGPVRAEPFNQAVNKMSKSEACAATATSLRKAFALIV